MNSGGMAIKKLNDTEAALSFSPICCVCLKKNEAHHTKEGLQSLVKPVFLTN